LACWVATARPPGMRAGWSSGRRRQRSMTWGGRPGLLVGGQSLLGLLAVGGGPGQLAAAVAGRMVELAAELVPLGPQLGRGKPPQIGAAGGVDGPPPRSSGPASVATVSELRVGSGRTGRRLQRPAALLASYDAVGPRGSRGPTHCGLWWLVVVAATAPRSGVARRPAPRQPKCARLVAGSSVRPCGPARPGGAHPHAVTGLDSEVAWKRVAPSPAAASPADRPTP
jgi:hypothetical protein